MPMSRSARRVRGLSTLTAASARRRSRRPSMALVNTKGEEIADAGVTGLRLLPDAKLEEIAAQLPELALIEIEFPKFRDGRGFTLGRTLRERYGYKGDLRAVGH